MDKQYLTQYFKTLLENQNRLQFDDDFVRELLANHLSHAPQKLYKYRECNKKNFNNLSSNTIFVPSANAFYDPFDYSLNFDVQAQSERISEFLSSKSVLPVIVHRELLRYLSKYHIRTQITLGDIENIYTRYFRKDGTCFKKQFEEDIVKPAKRNDQIAYQNIMKNIKAFLDHNSEQAKSIASDIAKRIYDVCQQPKNRSNIYCMSENNNSGPMWQHYAKKYTGYCVEYDFSSWSRQPMHIIKNLIHLHPVFYPKRRPPFDLKPIFNLATKELILNQFPTLEERMPIEIELNMRLLMKESDYSYEKEWRFAIVNQDTHFIPFPFVSAIYLGKEISQYNETRLKNIAKKLNVPVFKQKLSYYGNELRFEEIKR